MREPRRPRAGGSSGRSRSRVALCVVSAVAVAAIAPAVLLLPRRPHRWDEKARPRQRDENAPRPSPADAVTVPAAGGRAGATELAATFTAAEAFGVAHPDQIIDFDLPDGLAVDPDDCFMIGPGGGEVPCQVLRGGRRIAVRTDLPAGARREWRLMRGRAPKPSEGAVEIAERDGLIEITNGLVGIRVPSAAYRLPGGAAPLFELDNYPPDSEWAPRCLLPAPVQGVGLRDGTWTARGPNVLTTLAEKGSSRYSVEFAERGPLVARVALRYDVTTPSYDYGQLQLKDAGPGFCLCTITLEAGQPSILFEEETDLEMCHSFDLYEGLAPDRARYRGHHSDSPARGREPGGSVYRAWHERPAMDAEVDLTYAAPVRPRWGLRRLSVWDPWAVNTGWYWQAFSSAGAADSNAAGIFAGPPSRALGAGASGAGFYELPPAREGAPPSFGVMVESYRRTGSNAVHPRTRFGWGLFLGRKGEDVAPPTEVQPVARQMSLHGGVNLNKLHRLELDFPAPAQGYGAMYMPAASVARVVERLRRDDKGPHSDGYHGYLYGVEPSARPLVDMWKDASGRKVKEAADGVSKLARQLLDALVNGDGVYDFHYHYWHGGLAMSRMAVWIDQVLASDKAFDDDRSRARAAAVLFASILWDDDFVPLFDGHGLNLGTPNMPIQQRGYRHLYALLLSAHPMMRACAAEAAASSPLRRGRVEQVRESALAALRAQMNEHGAHMGSSHYVGAALGPTLSTLQQLRMAGVADAFSDQPRLAGFAEFYMNLLTPPEPRFGGVRKIPPIGDGSTESSELYGQLATGFAEADPPLSARLMRAWRENGAMHSGFHGTTLLKIDEDLPAEDLRLGSASFPGYYSVLRSGWGTPGETAVWLVDGAFYSDHYHDDLGEVVIYALGAPVSLDFGSMYSPRAAGGLVHSVVLPGSATGDAWRTESPPLDKGGRWGKATQESFREDAGGAFARARFERDRTVWTRAVSLASLGEGRPVIAIRDSFSGEDASAEKVFTLNMTAAGEVETPDGKRSPGQSFGLRAGVNRLVFEGQSWPAHVSKGVDWALCLVTDDPARAFIARWRHAWHPGREQGEFRRANGRDFEESQYILRVKGAGPFRAFLVPWRKGETPPDVRITRTGADVTVSAGARTVRFRADGSVSR